VNETKIMMLSLTSTLLFINNDINDDNHANNADDVNSVKNTNDVNVDDADHEK
jgi:hypothetical protein